MITNNISTLKIHKLTQDQYDRELEAGRIDENALYLTPDAGHNHTAAEITSGTLSSDRLPVVPVAKGGTGTAFSWLESAVLQEKSRVILIKEDANGSRYFDAYDSLPVANGGLGTGGAVNAQDNTLLVKQTDGNGVPFIDYTAYPKVESITIGNCTLNYDDDNKFLEFIFTSTTDTGTEV